MWEVKGRGWVVSSGCWARPGLVRSECDGLGRGTWTGDCWRTNDLHQNGSSDHDILSASHCTWFIWPAQTLFWRKGRGPRQGAWGGSVEDPLSILIIGRNICWWHKLNKISIKNLFKKVGEKCLVMPHLYSPHKAPRVGKAEEFLLFSLLVHQWPHEEWHRGSARRYLCVIIIITIKTITLT